MLQKIENLAKNFGTQERDRNKGILCSLFVQLKDFDFESHQDISNEIILNKRLKSYVKLRQFAIYSDGHEMSRNNLEALRILSK